LFGVFTLGWGDFKDDHKIGQKKKKKKKNWVKTPTQIWQDFKNNFIALGL
jgi:hypothetical protein